MLKYKYMSETEIINTILYAFKVFQNKKKREKYLMKKLSLNEDQLKYVLKAQEKTNKKELFKLSAIEDELDYENIYISKYDTYLHFKPLGYILVFLMILLTFLALLVFALSFIYENITNIVVLVFILLAIAIDLIIITIGFILKTSFCFINRRLKNDKVIKTEGIIKKIYVIDYTRSFLTSILSNNISFVILYLLSNGKTYKLYVPINPFEKNNSTRIINKLINEKYQNINVYIEFCKNAKTVKKSSIDFNEISKN